MSQLADSAFGPADGMASILRLPGWASALGSGGLPLDDELLTRTPYSREGARAATDAALAGDDPPTALSTVVTMTLGAVDAITAAGLRIPDEIPFVTFDDLPSSTLVQPPLAAVAQPVYRLGRPRRSCSSAGSSGTIGRPGRWS